MSARTATSQPPPGVLALAAHDFLIVNRDGRIDELLALVNSGERLYPKHINDTEIDDAILREALKHLALYQTDAEKVKEEYGLKPTRQVALGIRSAPHAVACIFAEHAIRSRFGDQSGHLAPLYHDGNDLRLNLPTHGLIVPTVRGEFIRAWQHYKTADDRAPRWITSSHLPRGAKVKPSIHITGAEYLERSPVCLMVNHTLEAEGMAQGGILCVVGLNGVSPAALVSQLHAELPGLAGVTLALDGVSPFLTRALSSAGLKWRVA